MNISGLNSNINANEIIKQLMAIERQPINNIEAKQNKLSKKKEIYNDVLGRLNNLKNLASQISSESTFNVFSVSYSEQSVIEWKTTSGFEADYNVTVNNIATAHAIGSDKKGSATEALGLNTGIIKINNVDIAIDNQDSLNSIRDKINEAGAGVKATIVDNILRLQSINTGASNQIALTENNNILVDLGILKSDLSIKNQFVAGADASVTIDGQNITSSSNTISDTVENVTIKLLKTGTSNVSVRRDISAIAGKITAFVNQYNSAIDFIYSKTTEKRIYPIEKESDNLAGLVYADVTLNNVKSNLNNLFVGAVSGLSESFDDLESIGISKPSFSKSDGNSAMLIGKLNIDAAKLNEALENNFEEVKSLFTKNSAVEGLETNQYGIGVRVNKYLYGITNSTTGVLTSRSSSFQQEINMLESQIESIKRRLEIREKSLSKKFTLMEAAIANADSQMAWLELQIGSM